MKQEKQKSKKINTFVSNIKLPYNPSELEWNKEHTQNVQRKYCYCGKDRTLTTLNMQCIQCKNWFHVECLKNPSLIVSKNSIVPFMTNYRFTCQLCSPEETFEKVTASWKDAINAAFANLSVERLRKEGLINKYGQGVSIIPEGYWFDKKDGICPFLDKHWEALCTNRARTPTWWATGVPSMKTSNYNSDSSKGKLKHDKSSKSQYLNKKSNNISEISSKHQKSLIKGSKSSGKLNSYTSSTSSSNSSSSISNSYNSYNNHSSHSNNHQNLLGKKTNKLIKKSSGFSIKLKEVSINDLLDNLDNSNSSKEHFYNKNGYKYERVEVNKKLENLVFRKKRDFNSLESAIHLCPFDCDSSINITKNGLTAYSNGGFRMARTNYGVKEGNWYFEIIVNKAGHGIGQQRTTNGPNVRVGWSRREATLHGPVGYDSYGYGYRDKTGEKLHESLPTPYGEPYKSGDVIGCYISLPSLDKNLISKLSKSNSQANNKNIHKSRYRSLSLKDINKDMIVNDVYDLPLDILSNKRVLHKRKIIKYKKRLYSETNDYLPINLPLIVQYNLKSKHSSLSSFSSDSSSSTNYEDSKDEIMNSIPLTSNDFPKLPNSKIVFYKNGKNQGIAFQDIPLPVAATSYLRPEYRNCKFEPYNRSSNIYDDGSLGYYPSVSLFKGGSVTLNFGPEFKYPPNDIEENWKPLCDRYDEVQIEESLYDIINEVSLEDNKNYNKQKYYIAISYDTKNHSNSNNNDYINDPLLKKRKTINNNNNNDSNNINGIVGKKRKISNDDCKVSKSESNITNRISNIKISKCNTGLSMSTKSIDNDSLNDNKKLQDKKISPLPINFNGKDNIIKIKNEDESINIDNNKIYNPKLFELSNMETDLSNIIENSIQSSQENSSMVYCDDSQILINHEKPKSVNDSEVKMNDTFEKMDSAIFINH
ncbi:hypothetical protein LY90DRAFT_677079 [Neocallimastix californiae]|uniref:B30.2/SPRY domain-containing protein n=1 Tax=Neocallimastix californiae TaxID=1754190 RepID=A0A1Y2AAY2_9FUNG|nr:hypothetical protein LY90DRAFT_677079 [Neocallimastix californiae]|eukprot:ORY19644.1 hypothetical protein LY90DRAFT_677079 [Neocallimastix californiae]